MKTPIYRVEIELTSEFESDIDPTFIKEWLKELSDGINSVLPIYPSFNTKIDLFQGEDENTP